MDSADVWCRLGSEAVLLRTMRTAVALSVITSAHDGRPARNPQRAAACCRRRSPWPTRSGRSGGLVGQLSLGFTHLEHVRPRRRGTGLRNLPPRPADTDLVYLSDLIR